MRPKAGHSVPWTRGSERTVRQGSTPSRPRLVEPVDELLESRLVRTGVSSGYREPRSDGPRAGREPRRGLHPGRPPGHEPTGALEYHGRSCGCTRAGCAFLVTPRRRSMTSRVSPRSRFVSGIVNLLCFHQRSEAPASLYPALDNTIAAGRGGGGGDGTAEFALIDARPTSLHLKM
jgi:hypothetical protein